MARRTPRRLAAVVALVIGLAAVVPATAADAKTAVNKSVKSTTIVVTPQVMDWWF